MKSFLCIVIISFAMAVAAHKGPRFHPNMCCNVTEPDAAAHDEIKTKIEACKAEVGIEKDKGKGEGKEDHGKFVCMTECMAKKEGMLNNDGTLNEAGATKFIKTKLAHGDHQIAVADEVCKKCIGQAKTSTDDGPKGDGKCGDVQMKIHKCVAREFFKACPADKQVKSEKCTKMRDAMNSGKFPPHDKEPKGGEGSKK